MTDEQKQATLLALKFLRQRDYTLVELTNKLAARFSSSDVDFVIEFAEKYRLIDDLRTANTRVKQNTGRRAVGDELLKEKMRTQGVPDELIEAAFAEMEDTEIDRARVVVSSKFPNGATRPKVARYLASRGFSEDTIESIIDSIPEGTEDV